MITASALAPNCAYVKVLSNRKARTPEQQASMDRGTEFHRAVEVWLASGVLPEVADDEIRGWLDLLAYQWLPPPEHVSTEQAWGLWSDGTFTPVTEPAPHVYVAADVPPARDVYLLTAGRADLDWREAAMLTEVDIKTGKWPVAAAAGNLQVNAAGMARAQATGAKGYVPAIYYARDGAWDFGEYVGRGSPEWSRQWEAVRAAASLPPEPRPGDHCGSCWERKACPQAQVR